MDKKNASVLITVVVVAAVIGGYYLLRQPPAEQSSSTVVGSQKEKIPTPPSLDELVLLINYTEAGYSPTSLIIQKGTTVKFVNQSSRAVWPASAKHPTHTIYPTTGGCLGSTFDACRGLTTGESWTFTFDIPGEWKYHDHLSPSFFGSIKVEE